MVPYKKWHLLISRILKQDPILSWQNNFIGLFSTIGISVILQCWSFVTFLYGNSPKQFVQIAFLKMLLHFYSGSIVFLKYYTPTVHWIHLFTYSLGLSRQRWTWWDCLSAKEYLRPTPHWHFLGFQTSSTLIPSFSSSGILFICLFLLSLHPSITCLYSSNHLFNLLSS